MAELPHGLIRHMHKHDLLSPESRVHNLKVNIKAFRKSVESCIIGDVAYRSGSIASDLGFLEPGPIGPLAKEYTDRLKGEYEILEKEYKSLLLKLEKCR